MKIDAVGVTTSNMKESINFYKLLGFVFQEGSEAEVHVEPLTPDGSARLMIDKLEIVRDIINEDPKPSNHSPFAIRYPTPSEVDEAASKVKNAGYKIVKEPWDAFWNQRYCVVEDPDGYRMDLYADLIK
jgi:catechol 2,3-dioxygenase-like lactoylglutathione lyase family enzyme